MASPSISEILSKTLFVGNLAIAESPKELKQRGITHILSVTSESYLQYPGQFVYLVLPILDDYSQRIVDLFEQAHRFIDAAKEADGAALIHCSAGVSRSGAFAVSYVMKKLSMRLKQALAFVRSRRRLTNPNFNFLNQLCEYEKQLFATDSSPPYIVEHVRSIWPDYTKTLSDETIAQILRASRFNHVEILYNLKKAASVEVTQAADSLQLVLVDNSTTDSSCEPVQT